jgi:Protein of unknown function (DUF1778)
MPKANTMRKAATQKGSRFSIRASATQKKVIAEAARIKDTTISDFVLEQSLTARSTSSPIRCISGCPKSSGRSSVTPSIRRQKRSLHCVNF